MRENKIMLGVSIIVIVMVTAPYIYSFYAAAPGNVFGGFLINPIDGHSYLAKMQLGYSGEWKFTLPYTSDSGDGAYIFLFYILLGHVARVFKTEITLLFHITRIFSALFFLWSAHKYSKDLFSESWQRIDWFIVCTLGAGLGWVAVFFGLFTSDFWVAEAYPFLSMYTNPHFSLGLGLMLWTLLPSKKLPLYIYLLLGLSLGILQPFAVVIVVLVIAARAGFEIAFLQGTILQRLGKSQHVPRLILLGLVGGAVLGYQFVVIMVDPHLAAWNMQNITPSPEILDLLFSLMPCLILALMGTKHAWQTEGGKVLVLWGTISLCLIFIPWSLQRRFLTGIFIPISGLAIIGLANILSSKPTNKRFASILLIILVIPTNLIVVYSGLQASTRNDPAIYWSADLSSAFKWIKEKTPIETVFLADEVTGLYIPSQTGRRVVYGHPFETINAEIQLDFIDDFFSGKYNNDDIEEELQKRNIGYVVSKRELDKINQDMSTSEFPVVFGNSEVIIYHVE
jgi:hypothetical protein